MKSLYLIALLSLSYTTSAISNETIISIGKMDGRSYHQDIYDSCKNCHDQGIKIQPSDNSCQSCHELEDLIAQTSSPNDNIKSHNPHDNFHYGTDVPCTECHGEHEYKPPLCSNCHSNLKFKNHK